MENKRTRRVFSKALKAEAVASSQIDGITKAANSFQVQPSQIAKWRKELGEEGPRVAVRKPQDTRIVALDAQQTAERIRVLKRLLDSLLAV